MQAPEIVRESVTKIGMLFGVKEKAEEDPALPSNAIDLLTMQHREVDALFEQIEKAGDRAHKTKNDLARQLIEKLVVHTHIEEVLFYPAVKEIDKDLVLEAYEEHDGAKHILQRLAETDASDETFDAKVCFLKESIHHHVREEETELFPKVRASLDSTQLQLLGESMIEEMTNVEEANEPKVRKRSMAQPKAASTRRKTKTASTRSAKKSTARGKAPAKSSKKASGRKATAGKSKKTKAKGRRR